MDLTKFKSKLPSYSIIKITPVIETMLVNLADNLVSNLFCFFKFFDFHLKYLRFN